MRKVFTLTKKELQFKTMVPWNFDLIWINYETMGEKTMVLRRNLQFYGQNYGTIPKTMELQLMKGKHGKLSKNCEL